MVVRTLGSRTTSTRWPGAETKMRPEPQSRVQIAGEVTGRFQASHGLTSWVVVASTSLYSSLKTQYCSVSRSKSSIPRVIWCDLPRSEM